MFIVLITHVIPFVKPKPKTMKKLRLLLFFSIILLAAGSCKKEEAFTIVGKWNFDKVSMSLFMNDIPISNEIKENAGWIQFNKDKTGTVFTYADEENDEPESEGTFTWTLDGNQLTITSNEGDDIFMDVPLTLTTMDLNFVIAETTVIEDWEGLIFKVAIVFEWSRISK